MSSLIHNLKPIGTCNFRNTLDKLNKSGENKLFISWVWRF
jgi:hypothetical protein